MRLGHKVSALIIVPLVFELIFICVLTHLLEEAQEEIQRESHVTAILTKSGDIPRYFFEAGQALATFALSRSKVFEQQYADTVEKIPEELRIMEVLVHENPRQRELYKRFEEASAEALDVFATTSEKAQKELDATHVMSSAQSKFRLQLAIDDLIKTLHDMTSEESKVKQESPFIQDKNNRLISICLVSGVAMNVILTIVLAVFIHSEMTRRLKVLMDNTALMAAKKKLNQPIPGDDEIGQLDRVFHDMADQLESAAQYKQQLMSMVSHDLRTPLTSIGVSIDLILAGNSGKIGKETSAELQLARRSTGRLITHINDLLALERMEDCRLELFGSSESLRSLALSSVESVSALAQSKNISIRLPTEDTNAYVDGQRIAQVISNLLSNAVKFSPENSEIVVAWKTLPEFIEVTVTDHGAGIPALYHTSIFDRFQQVKGHDQRANSADLSGSGLGLAICKYIVQAHGGTIGVDSQEGSGSTFWFRVPND